jgi:hypothetical protein
MGFGHHAVNVAGAHIDSWGRGPLVLRRRGRVWRFEFSARFGPSLLLADMHTVSRLQPVNSDHPFWEAFEAWRLGGMRHRPVLDRHGRLRFFLCHARGPSRDLRTIAECFLKEV